MDDEDFSEDLAALGGPRGASGARHDRDRTHSQAPSQAWPGGQSRRILGDRSALLGQRFARLELNGQIGVVVVGWDWGTGEWAKSSTLVSFGAACCKVLE